MKLLSKREGRRWIKMIFWEPVIGCTPCSPACIRCGSARGLGDSLTVIHNITQNNPAFPENISERTFNGVIKLQPDELKKCFSVCSQVFVCGRSDLFHEAISVEYLKRILGVIEEHPDSTFFALTKRPRVLVDRQDQVVFPDNLWLGISAENQALVDSRLVFLKDIHCKYRNVSLKPLLGPVDLSEYISYLDFVIVGGETGIHARPMHPDWVRKVRDQCIAADISFQFHQWGSWGLSTGIDAKIWVNTLGSISLTNNGGQPMKLVGRKEAGWMIDGAQWDQYPDTYRIMKCQKE